MKILSIVANFCFFGTYPTLIYYNHLKSPAHKCDMPRKALKKALEKHSKSTRKALEKHSKSTRKAREKNAESTRKAREEHAKKHAKSTQKFITQTLASSFRASSACPALFYFVLRVTIWLVNYFPIIFAFSEFAWCWLIQVLFFYKWPFVYVV